MIWDGNQISDLGCQHLCSALQSNTTLQELDLRYNKISDLGCQHLCSALQSNTTLQELYLGGNKISDLGYQCLGYALQNHPYLQEKFKWDEKNEKKILSSFPSLFSFKTVTISLVEQGNLFPVGHNAELLLDRLLNRMVGHKSEKVTSTTNILVSENNCLL